MKKKKRLSKVLPSAPTPAEARASLVQAYPELQKLTTTRLRLLWSLRSLRELAFAALYCAGGALLLLAAASVGPGIASALIYVALVVPSGLAMGHLVVAVLVLYQAARIDYNWVEYHRLHTTASATSDQSRKAST